MATCAVLRCNADAVDVISTDRNGSRFEWAVCEDHRDLIDSGEPYRPDYEQRVITIRADIRASDDYLFDKVTSVRRIDLASDVDKPQYEVRIGVRRAVLRGDADDEHEYPMMISQSALRGLGQALITASNL